MVNFGQRLKSARKMAKFSMDKLVSKIDHIVSKQSISKYENGVMKPENSDIIIKIANALNVPVDYFYRENEISISGINFRKKAALGKKEIVSIRERVKDHLERYFELEDLLNIRNEFINPISGMNISLVPEIIENAANNVRSVWGIGEKASIPSVINLFEKNNIKIIELDVSEGFEGLSGRVEEIPFIVLNKNVTDDRKRFTAIHELAHLILNIDQNEQDKAEKICHYFAGAFLISRKALEEALGQRTKISLNELIEIKEQYGISIQAIMAREYFLGFISEYNYTNFNIYFNKMGFRKDEPGEYYIIESSSRFRQLIYRAVAEEAITISKAASLARSSIADIAEEIAIVD